MDKMNTQLKSIMEEANDKAHASRIRRNANKILAVMNGEKLTDTLEACMSVIVSAIVNHVPDPDERLEGVEAVFRAVVESVRTYNKLDS